MSRRAEAAVRAVSGRSASEGRGRGHGKVLTASDEERSEEALCGQSRAARGRSDMKRGAMARSRCKERACMYQ